MNPLRQLLSQTAVYGLSSIVGRFLNYLLVPLYTYRFSAGEYGVVSEFYAYAGFFAVVLVWGLETGYFRFRQQQAAAADAVYQSALSLLLLSSGLFVTVIALFQQPLANALHYADHPEYALWFACILALDAMTALPFARLRAENRARRFAAIKLLEIAITIALNLLVLWLLPRWQAAEPEAVWLAWFQPSQGVAYIFMANLIASGCKTALLLPQFRGTPFRLDTAVLKPLLGYSLPMVVIGLAGMVNEMLDRVLLKWLLPFDAATNLQQLGIYAACYKLAMVMSLFVQAFRYAGEPFFFAMAGRADAQRAYALVMQGFVAFGVLIFLVVTLFLDVFQYFIGAEYRAGLAVVPVLLLANLCLGIYVNLSIWYKLSNRTGLGAWVALLGAAVTGVLNVVWIPVWGYAGSAWATLICYALMVLVSWLLGQRFYPVRYPLGWLGVYLAVGLLLVWGCEYAVSHWQWPRHGVGVLGVLVYVLMLLLQAGQARLARR